MTNTLDDRNFDKMYQRYFTKYPEDNWDTPVIFTIYYTEIYANITILPTLPRIDKKISPRSVGDMFYLYRQLQFIDPTKISIQKEFTGFGEYDCIFVEKSFMIANNKNKLESTLQKYMFEPFFTLIGAFYTLPIEQMKYVYEYGVSGGIFLDMFSFLDTKNPDLHHYFEKNIMGKIESEYRIGRGGLDKIWEEDRIRTQNKLAISLKKEIHAYNLSVERNAESTNNRNADLGTDRNTNRIIDSKFDAIHRTRNYIEHLYVN